ncbi:MAG: hypothetical protein AB7I36_00720 [Rhodospirillaceae bacterium]
MFGTSDVGKAPRTIAALCLVLLAAHAGLAGLTRNIQGAAPVLTPPPGTIARKALAFGDDQFLYRRMAIGLQNAGDGGGKVTPISQYNYSYVLGWLNSLAALDPNAAHHFILASRYFSYTQNESDLRRVIDFVVEKAVSDPRRHWYWLVQCIDLADHRLKDTEYALRISRIAATYDFPEVPHWVWMFPALLLEKLGRPAEGYSFMEQVRSEKGRLLTTEEINWLDEISYRLKMGQE